MHSAFLKYRLNYNYKEDKDGEKPRWQQIKFVTIAAIILNEIKMRTGDAIDV